ncbi:MAG: hypothetical protein AB1705_10280 [Verrucomicrobiota bacterium]
MSTNRKRVFLLLMLLLAALLLLDQAGSGHSSSTDTATSPYQAIIQQASALEVQAKAASGNADRSASQIDSALSVMAATFAPAGTTENQKATATVCPSCGSVSCRSMADDFGAIPPPRACIVTNASGQELIRLVFPELPDTRGQVLAREAEFVQLAGDRLLFRKAETAEAQTYSFAIEQIHPRVHEYLGVDVENLVREREQRAVEERKANEAQFAQALAQHEQQLARLTEVVREAQQRVYDLPAVEPPKPRRQYADDPDDNWLPIAIRPPVVRSMAFSGSATVSARGGEARLSRGGGAPRQAFAIQAPT